MTADGPDRLAGSRAIPRGPGLEAHAQRSGDATASDNDRGSAEQTVSVGPGFEPPAVEYITQPAQLEAVLPDLLQAPTLALDTETTGLDPLTDSLRLIQVATPTHTYIFDAHRCPVQMLTPLFTTERRFIGHNLKFDLKFLVAAGLPWPTGPLADTMLAAQLLGAGAPTGRLNACSLAAVVERYLALRIDKQEQRRDWAGPLNDRQLRYATLDAAILWPLYGTLETALRQASLMDVAELENACIRALAWLELAGLPMNTGQWLERAGLERHRMESLVVQLDALVDQATNAGGGLTSRRKPRMNWGSPAQVLQLMQARGHAIVNTDSATLLGLLGQDPLVERLLEYREAAKRAGTYGESWLADHLHRVTGRIHADYVQLGSASGRMSCHHPNVQNLPRSAAYRAAVEAREGYRLVKADWSQIELRLAAALARDEAMLAAFRAGEDLHIRTASQVLGVPADQITADHRQLAKALNFGLIYGMGAGTLREYAYTTYHITLTPEAARAHRQRFFEAYPGLAQWRRQTRSQLQPAQHAIDTRMLAGRRRLGVNKFTIALNSPVQGSGADGLKLAMARLFQHRDEVPSARLVAVVHDEILAECPEEDAEATAQWLTSHMSAAMQTLVGDVVPITVEVKIGQSWAG
jgi:DNA polymerase I